MGGPCKDQRRSQEEVGGGIILRGHNGPKEGEEGHKLQGTVCSEYGGYVNIAK